MANYLPHEIDPETIHVTVDVPFREHLLDLMDKAIDLARRGKVVLIHHQHDDAYENPDGTSVPVADYIGYRDYEPDFFNKGILQCPRDADARYEEQFNQPRPFPSMIVEENTAKVAVSKPSLCDSCEFGLRRKMTGNCHGFRFKELPKVIK